MSFFQRLFGPSPQAQHQEWEAAFHNAEQAAAQQDLQQALPLFEKALRLAEAVPPDARLRVTIEGLAEVCSKLGQHTRSAELQERSLELTIAQKGRESEPTATALNNLGCAYREARLLDKAQETLMESLRIREQLLGHDHPDVAASLNNLAALLDQQEQPQRAEEYFRAALGILQRHEKLDDIANVLDNLGAISMKLGKADEAEKCMRHGLDAWVVAQGRDSWDYALSANNLARLYFLQKRYAEAEPLIRQTVEIAESVLGPEHPQVADFLNGHGAILEGLGREADAQQLYARAEQITAVS